MDQSTAILQRYQELATLSARMLDVARQGQWDDLGDIEARRDAIVADLQGPLSAGGIPDDIQKVVANLIVSILNMDAETRSLAEAWKTELQEILSSVGTEIKLSRAYGG